MSTYGFRLFKLDIKKSGRGNALDVLVGPDDAKMHFSDYLFELATSRLNVAVHGTPLAKDNADDAEDGEDEPIEDEDDEEGDATMAASAVRPVLMITEVTHRGDHVVIDYIYGRRSGYTQAGYSETEDEAPYPIAKLKSVRPYRSVFLFPETGPGGVVAIEDTSRLCPHKKLEQWLKAWAREDAHATLERLRAETGKRTHKVSWWSTKFTPLSDPRRLEAVMQNGSSTEIILVKAGGSDARMGGRDPLRVQMGLTGPGAVAAARALINTWFPREARKERTTQAEATKDLAALLAEQYSGFDSEGYDDAWINVKDSSGRAKQVSPSRWADIFTYPVGRGEDRPFDKYFYREVMRAVKRLQGSLELDIDWSGWGEGSDE